MGCVFGFGERHFCTYLDLEEVFLGLLSVEEASVRLFSYTPSPPWMKVSRAADGNDFS